MKTTAKLLCSRQPTVSILEEYNIKEASTDLNPIEVLVSMRGVIKPEIITALQIQIKIISGSYLILKKILITLN